MAYVYILESLADGRFYIGSTLDLATRLKHHFAGGTPTTKRFGGVKLVFKQKYDTLGEARSIERKLKKLKRKDYLRKVIKDGLIKMRP
jgi:putative endonuclease